MRSLILLTIIPLNLYAGVQMEPWGKDASLATACRQISSTQCVDTPILGPFAEAGIWFHQEVISPADGPRSHFFPSSSQYTLESMRRYGFFRGFLLGCDRLMRENEDPWVYKTMFLPSGDEIKYNPVP